MPLVVPLLRLSLLLLNVYDTFKTLKPPKPARAAHGRPSAKTITQRKRAMKGCLAVWVIWCCYASYERTFDGLVSLLVPFYSELKSIVLLFLLLTRARGAEPLFLHIVRPLLKPHTPAVDAALEIARVLGDFAFELVAVPVRVGWRWGREKYAMVRDGFWSGGNHDEGGVAVQDDADAGHGGSLLLRQQPQDDHRPFPNGYGQPPAPTTHSRTGLNSYPYPTQPHAQAGPSGEAETRGEGLAPGYPGSRVPARSAPRAVSDPATGQQHEIWRPPPAAYASDSELPDQNESTPPPDDEWRAYPPFPSAYPPTPLATRSALPRPPSVGADDPEWRTYERFPAAYPPTPVHRGGAVLPASRPISFSAVEEEEEESEEDQVATEPLGPVAEEAQLENEEQNGDESQGDNDDEDDFDVTLRTPFPGRIVSSGSTSSSVSQASSANGLTVLTTAGTPFPGRIASSGSTSSSVSQASSANGSTVLTTAGTESSLRTRTSSGTSGSTNGSSRASANASVSGSEGSRRRAYERVWVGNTVVGIKTLHSDSETDSDEDGIPVETDGTGTGTESSDADAADERILPGVTRRRVVPGAGRARGVNSSAAHATTRSSARLAGAGAARAVAGGGTRSAGAGTGAGAGASIGTGAGARPSARRGMGAKGPRGRGVVRR